MTNALAKPQTLLRLLSLGVAVVSLWVTRDAWLTGPAPTYQVAVQLLRDGQFDVRVYNDAWYSAQVLIKSAGAVSDFLSPSPPTTPILLLPLGLLSGTALNVSWALANFAALIGAITLSLATCSSRRHRLLLVLSATGALLSAPLYENLYRGQVYVFILLLYAVGLWAITHAHDGLAGVTLGILLAIKLSGWPLWIILLAWRRWRILLWASASVVVIVIATLLVMSAQVWLVYLTQTLPHWSASVMATVPAYQTVNGFFQHLFRYDAELNPSPIWDAPPLATLLSLGLTLLMLAITLTRTKQLHWLVGIVLSVILAPLAEQYHFLILTAPFALLAVQWHRFNFETRVVFMLAIALVIAPLPYKNPQWWQGAWALFAYPRLYGALILWALLIFTPSDAD